MANLKPTEVVTGPVRISWPALFEPRLKSPELDPAVPDNLRYQATLLFPPDYDLKPLYAALQVAALERFGPNFRMSRDKNPIKDAEIKSHLDGYEEGWHFLNVKSKFKPAVVDQRRSPIDDPDKIYPGCWCRFLISTFAWENKIGGKGVSFGLNMVQLVRDDTRLDGRKPALDVFDAVEVDGESNVFSDDASAEESQPFEGGSSDGTDALFA